MSKATEQIVNAFLAGDVKNTANGSTDGVGLMLFGNRIAEHRKEGLWITNCGWFTMTTKARLNALPDVSIKQVKNKWYLNGNEWDGTWIKVNSNRPPVIDQKRVGTAFDMSTVYVSVDGWRGYNQPIYAICGANDTGTFSDSPCPSDVCERELNLVTTGLRLAGIPFKEMVLETSNVFCVHRYIVVPPKHEEFGKMLVDSVLANNETGLLYKC